MSAVLSQQYRRPTAIIAEDEQHLAEALRWELAKVWPELHVMCIVNDGISAVKQAQLLKPDVLFFDIRMPGKSGLEAAAELAETWTGNDFPSLVFVTAYDQYALQAFDAQAVDYLLKPVSSDRLQKTVVKLHLAGLSKHNTEEDNSRNLENTFTKLGKLLSETTDQMGTAIRLKFIKVNLPLLGNSIKLIPIEDVLYFTATDKYVQVVAKTDEGYKEFLIRTPLKDLLPQLDPAVFWKIHRSTVVRASAIDVVQRDHLGKLSLTLRGRTGSLAVSRLYTHLFKTR